MFTGWIFILLQSCQSHLEILNQGWIAAFYIQLDGKVLPIKLCTVMFWIKIVCCSNEDFCEYEYPAFSYSRMSYTYAHNVDLINICPFLLVVFKDFHPDKP